MYCTFKRDAPLGQPQPCRKPFGIGPRTWIVYAGRWLTRVSREINQSKTTSVRILSLALVISCLHFRGYVIFNLIIFHLQRVSFSLCLKITGTSRRKIDLLEKMLTRKSKPEIGQEDEKGSLASILALFFKSTGSVSYPVKNMDLFVSLVGLDYGR